MNSATRKEAEARNTDPLSSLDDERVSGVTFRARQRAAEKLLHMGEPLLAYNEVQQALEENPGDFRLRQLKGLALARSGALHRANEVLAALREEGCTNAETMGPLARTHKDLALSATDTVSREQHLTAAFEIYQQAYREAVARDLVDEAYYTGINAATIELLRDNVERARAIATDVELLCQRALANSSGKAADAYWPRATLAEAALIAGDLDCARDRYAAAVALAGNNYGDLSSTKHQARILLDHLNIDLSWLDTAIRIPPVLVFTGHMIDGPGRAVPRFPTAAVENVRREIQRCLEELRPAAAYGSAACGADILCLECVRELGGELHIVLPFPADQFRTESVNIGCGGDWEDRFDQLLDAAEEVLVVSDKPPPSGASTFQYANLVMTGLARLRSQMLETNLRGLAVWDGTGAGDVGGTRSVVDMWRRYGVPLEHVNPCPDSGHSADVSPETAPLVSQTPNGADKDLEFLYRVKTMLFTDAVGYTRLSEDQIPLFFEHYLGAIARYNEITDCRAEHIETAGDGMYMVFDDPHAAGHYALGLSDLINGRDWRRLGLPEDLSVRIGLHCGPVFVGRDPITGTPLYTGIHASRTARIEPITPPGQVYASGAYAAVAAARGIEGLRFSYIGRTQLAKQYGALALYHVKRP